MLVKYFGTKYGCLKCSNIYAKLHCSFEKYSYIKPLVNHTVISFHKHYSISKFFFKFSNFANKEQIWTSQKEHVSYYSLQMQLILQLPNRTKSFPSNSRSSHQRCSVKKGVLRNFAKFIGKHMCRSLFFNKIAGLGPATLLKRRLWHRCFSMNFEKFQRTPS